MFGTLLEPSAAPAAGFLRAAVSGAWTEFAPPFHQCHKVENSRLQGSKGINLKKHF